MVEPERPRPRSHILWVGGLGDRDNETTIRHCFDADSDIRSIEIRRGQFRDGRGYAFVTFGGLTEAEVALGTFDNTSTLFCRRCAWDVVNEDPRSLVPPVPAAADLALHECETDDMPSLQEQLSPLSESQLRARLTKLQNPSDPDEERTAYRRGGRIAKKDYLLDRLARSYRSGAAAREVERVCAGVELPRARLKSMLDELRRTEWGKKGGVGRKVDAQRYLVLGKASHDSAHKVAKANRKLWEMAMALLDEFCPDADDGRFRCTSLAVTKNFVGSPHLDAKDTSYQFALSLGTLEAGGELCVESEDGARISVVSTLDKMVRVDGRFVHWVRGYDPERERFSLIYFCVDPAVGMDRGAAVY